MAEYINNNYIYINNIMNDFHVEYFKNIIMNSKRFLSLLLLTCNEKYNMDINENCLIKQLNIIKNELNVYDVKLPVLGLAGLNYVIYQDKKALTEPMWSKITMNTRLLIFHIKRFQLSNNRWIKSSRPVRFPITSFHPSKYLAQRSSTNSLQFQPRDDNISTSSSSSLSSITTTTTTTPEAVSSSSIDNMLILSPSRLVNGNHNYLKQTNEQHKGLPPPETINESIKKKKKKRFGRRRKKFEIDNSQRTLNPPRFSQMVDRTLSFGDNSFDADNAAYNLYALVCHYGVIGGGHYVAFVKNHTNQQWYCFNDSSCKPVSESVLEQCSSSAYLLFYERESLDHRCYMPNVEGKKQVANEFPLISDDRWCSLM
ncbi:unnamed protein product [Rotaria sp. Silwood1]|nr:unnamed protein product [Rotaria sp. Silwood1]